MRNIAAHGADRVLSGDRHRQQKELGVFLGVAKRLLAVEQGGRVGRHRRYIGRQVFEYDLRLVQPGLIGLRLGQAGFQLSVVDDAPLFEIDEEHLARLQAPFLDDFFVRDVEHADLRAHDHQIVLGADIAGRAQAIAVQGGADLAAIGKGHRRRSVPGFHHGGMKFVKSAALGIHQRIVVPGFRDHQHHGVGQGIAAGDEQFERVVKGRRIGDAVGDQRPQFFQIIAE